MTRSRASNANLVDGMGRQLKSQKGKVDITESAPTVEGQLLRKNGILVLRLS
jgi:hypothetical protein